MRHISEEHREKIKQAHLKRNAEKTEKICKLAIAGRSISEISIELDVTKTSVSKLLRKHGVKAVRPTNPRKGKSTKQYKIDEICQMIKDGKKVKEIVEHYNTQGFKHSSSFIYSVLNKNGIECPRELPNSNPDKIKEICSMFDTKSIKEIADHFNCNRSYISRVLTKNGFHSTNPERIQIIIDMYKNGSTVTEISKHFGFSGTGYVSRILCENGLRTHKPKRTDGISIDSQGYVRIRVADDDPMVCMRTKRGTIAEHRLNLARKLGRPLTSEETAHHKDGNKQNNDPSNLQLRKLYHGKGVAMNCFDCNSINIVSGDFLKCGDCNSTRMSFSEL